MARPPKACRRRGGRSQLATCEGAVVRGYAGGYRGVGGVDREGVGGAVGIGVLEDHLGKVKRSCKM